MPPKEDTASVTLEDSDHCKSDTEVYKDDDNTNLTEIKQNESDDRTLACSLYSDEKTQEATELWSLNENEKAQLVELQSRVSDVDHWKNEPFELVRFVRARPNDVPAAEELFRNMVKWRVENNVDTVLEDPNLIPSDDLVECFPGAIMKDYDKDGDPIFVKRVGVVDGLGVLKHYGKEEMMKYAIWFRELCSRGEWLQDYEKRQGRPVTRITIITDMKGLNAMHMNRDLMAAFKETSKLDQDNYCETAKRIIIIRAPTIFRVIWNMVKYLLDPGVKEKIIFARSDYIKDLDQYMDREVLPNFLCAEGKGEVAKGMPVNFEARKPGTKK